MNVKYLLTVIIIFCISLNLNAQNNIELQQMADADQKSRNVGNIDWKILNKEDSLRRVRVFELIEKRELKTAQDHLNAGIIFQHGNDTISSAMAVKSFETALKMDSTLNRWWYAAAVDRDLMRHKKPQIYGTQFIQDATNGKWKLYEIDTTKITDDQRAYYSVETLSAQKEKEWKMNLKPIAQEYASNHSIEETISSIKKQYQEGRLLAFSLEEEINMFGYELVSQNKNEEALKIFELNTQLYPSGFNTFDSYGEMLMKIGKNKEALKAYKKSLQINPKNENAKEMINQLQK